MRSLDASVKNPLCDFSILTLGQLQRRHLPGLMGKPAFPTRLGAQLVHCGFWKELHSDLGRSGWAAPKQSCIPNPGASSRNLPCRAFSCCRPQLLLLRLHYGRQRCLEDVFSTNLVPSVLFNPSSWGLQNVRSHLFKIPLEMRWFPPSVQMPPDPHSRFMFP